MKDIKLKISFNSPVILSFFILSFMALILGIITGGYTTNMLFCIYRYTMFSPLTYIRLFTHVLGHADWNHFIGNIMLLLVIGPPLEKRYGSKIMILLILLTAFFTGIVFIIVFPQKSLLGASGVVFALILLSSFSGSEEGKIPLTFILVAIFYIGQEIIIGITTPDNISNMTHILGGAVGAVMGHMLNKGE
jgi:rhomboid-like protein